MSPKQKAVFVLVILVPAPSIGVIAAMMFFPNTIHGSLIFMASKIWLFLFPLIWHVFYSNKKISISPPVKGGFGPAALTGFFLSLIILTVYFLFGKELINREFMRVELAKTGLTNPLIYVAGASYWILINSVLEEYVWRWFVVEQSEVLFSPLKAVFVSALFFTIHHIIAMNVYFPPLTVSICSLGVFTGGAIWSYLYIRYRSIWPCYLSHAIVDLCIFLIGAHLIWGK